MIVVLVGIGVMLSALVVQGIAAALGLEAIGALLARHSARRSAIRVLRAYPTIPRSDDNKDAVIVPISLCPNRGKSADFVLISGR